MGFKYITTINLLYLFIYSYLSRYHLYLPAKELSTLSNSQSCQYSFSINHTFRRYNSLSAPRFICFFHFLAFILLFNFTRRKERKVLTRTRNTQSACILKISKTDLNDRPRQRKIYSFTDKVNVCILSERSQRFWNEFWNVRHENAQAVEAATLFRASWTISQVDREASRRWSLTPSQRSSTVRNFRLIQLKRGRRCASRRSCEESMMFLVAGWSG